MQKRIWTSHIIAIAAILLLCGACNTASAQIKNAKTGRLMAMDSLRDGIKVTIRGKAKDAKYSAVIVTNNDEVIYIEQVHSWDRKTINKEIEVAGVVRIVVHTKEEWRTSNGQPTQHMGEGRQFILERVTWKLVP